MNCKNKYFKSSRLSEAKFREIIKYFSEDLSATCVAELSGVSRNSINNILTKIRIRMAQICEQESPFSGEVEVDESYFGARRVRGKTGRGAQGKTIVSLKGKQLSLVY